MLCVIFSFAIGAQQEAFSQSKDLPVSTHSVTYQLVSFRRYDQQTHKVIDETSTALKQSNIVVKRGDLYFQIELDASEKQLVDLFFRVEDYDLTWYRFDNGPIRSGMFPEGRYFVVVAMRNPNGEMTEVYRIQMQIRANFFHGMRGAVAIAVISFLLIFISFSSRHLILKRDKRHTVRMLENTVKKRTEQLQDMVAQRELLLKEIHHRVKNNLQVISSLLEMQAARTEDKNVKDAITEGQNRVLSIAFIHQNLYQHDDLKGVEIGSFLKELIKHVRHVFQVEYCEVEVTNLVPMLYLDIDSAIPLGLIINELLTNSYKYAFRGKSRGAITIELRSTAVGHYYFKYQDDGVGIPESFDFNKSNSLGLKLIRQLSRQLHGNIEYKYENGSNFELNFLDMATRNKIS